MLSCLQIAFALGGKIHGRGVLAPAPGRWLNYLSMAFVPNEAGDVCVVNPDECRIYVANVLDGLRAVSGPARPERPNYKPGDPALVWGVDYRAYTTIKAERTPRAEPLPIPLNDVTCNAEPPAEPPPVQR